MSSGAFGYPLCFSAMIVVIGLMVSPRPAVRGPASKDTAPATTEKRETTVAKAPRNPKIDAELAERCEEFFRKYPDSERFEAVATTLCESLVESGNWKEVRNLYHGLETRFPKSENLDCYVFFQAIASFQEANFAESTPLLETFLKRFPNSRYVENALYYLAMSHFLSNDHKETLAACAEYLKKYPDGQYAGDIRYRLAFIDFNDKEDKSEKLIRDIGAFLKKHPDDLANGSMYCLMADTYKRMEQPDEALAAYINAVETDSPDDVIQYAIDSATAMLKESKDWATIAKLHGDFMQRKPDSQLALLSAGWVAKMYVREGKNKEAAELLANSLKDRIDNPDNEQVEYLIDELVKTLVPRKKPKDLDADAIDSELRAILKKIVAGQENLTTAARVYYARARLAQLLRRNDLSDLYLKDIATANAKDPSGLSPALLAACGEVLLKSGEIAGAESMLQRLKDHYPKADCGDVGLVGLGHVALARNTPAAALDIFEQALMKPENRRFKEATLGKLEALVDLDQLETAEKLALEIIGDRNFRGELMAKAYLLLARIYQKQAAKAEGEKAHEWLKKAHEIFQRVYSAYQAFPDLCAEGYWQAYETAKQLGETKVAEETLKMLKAHPKLKNTERRKQAEMER